ncbi:MAG: Gfo/Idh/MocA family oxidoreductase [Oscillospiraceae bacterium]|nr:Gfo/Idh/MocA family oxidoreductase [Oscillospiraceae bacterium]
MKKVRWCIIGAGGIADRRSIPGMLLDPQNEIVAVMDTVPAVAQKVAEKYGFPHYFSDAEEMLKTVDSDAVYIATPVFCHYDQAMLALKHGRHVFMEKPITLGAKEGKKLLNAFKKAGKQLMIGYMMGYHNLHVKARNLIQSGGIGDVNLFKLQFTCWYPDIPGAWRQTRAYSGGGAIMDLAVHCMELFTSITGEDFEKCTAYFTTKTFNYEVEDSAVITFKSEKGILGHIDVNFNVPDNAATGKMEIYGTAGSIVTEGTLSQEEVGRMKYIYSPQGDYEAQQNRISGKAQTYYGKGGNMYTKQFAAFGKLILSGKTDYTNAERALRIQELCDEMYKHNHY